MYTMEMYNASIPSTRKKCMVTFYGSYIFCLCNTVLIWIEETRSIVVSADEMHTYRHLPLKGMCDVFDSLLLFFLFISIMFLLMLNNNSFELIARINFGLYMFFIFKEKTNN